MKFKVKGLYHFSRYHAFFFREKKKKLLLEGLGTFPRKFAQAKNILQMLLSDDLLQVQPVLYTTLVVQWDSKNFQLKLCYNF